MNPNFQERDYDRAEAEPWDIVSNEAGDIAALRARVERLEAAARFTLKSLKDWHKDSGVWAECQDKLREALESK